MPDCPIHTLSPGSSPSPQRDAGPAPQQPDTATALRQADERFQLVVEAAPYGLLMVNSTGTVTMANPQCEAIFGFTQEELLGHSIDRLLPHPYREAHGRHLLAFFANPVKKQMGGLRDLPALRKDGTSVPVEIGLTPIHTPEGLHTLATVIDVSVRKSHEAALLRLQNHLEEEVSARTKDLEQAKSVAESANAAKSIFLANMSHELRTPMHAILSFAELAATQLERGETPKVRRYLTRLRESGHDLLTLLNDILDLSKLESGRMVYHHAPVNLATITHTIAKELDLLRMNKNLTLTIQPPSFPTLTQGDALRLSQVIRNLLSNALKFTGEGTAITISFSPATLRAPDSSAPTETIQAIALTIRDQGIGFPPEEAEAIFDKFVQSSRSRSSAGGTGLGLAICKEIVTAHHGRIWGETHPEGGASFTVVLPVDSPTARQEAA